MRSLSGIFLVVVVPWFIFNCLLLTKTLTVFVLVDVAFGGYRLGAL